MRRKRNNKKIMLLGLLLLVLGLSIGFAYLTQVLKINSTAHITKTNWDIHFENVVVREGSVEGTYPIIDESRTTVSLTVSLAKPKDFYEYEVDVVNSGSMDAKVENVEITTLTEAQAKYLNYEVIYKDGTTINKNDLLKVGEKETIKVRVEFKDVTDPADLPDSTETIEFICKIDYGQDDGSGTKKPFDIETAPILASKTVFDSALRNVKSNTKTITFNDQIDIPENAIGSADISDKQDGSVMAYWVPNSKNSSLYDLYIEGDGALYANPDMSSYFMNFQKVTTIENGDKLDMSLVTNMSYMFSYCTALTALDTSNWDVSNVTNMSYMFMYCNVLTTLDVANWDVSNVTNMDQMFNYCNALTTLDVSNWDLSNVTSMIGMFHNCKTLTTLDTSNWDVSNVTDMSGMFSECTALKAIDTSNWDLSNVTKMVEMFNKCSALTTIDTSNWNLSHVTDMSDMFRDCTALKTIGGTWNLYLSNVTIMNGVFYNCHKLTMTLNIHNPINNSVKNMFSGINHQNGEKIILNYTKEGETTVNNIIANKPSKANIIKGTLIQ